MAITTSKRKEILLWNIGDNSKNRGHIRDSVLYGERFYTNFYNRDYNYQSEGVVNQKELGLPEIKNRSILMRSVGSELNSIGADRKICNKEQLFLLLSTILLEKTISGMSVDK